MAWDSPSDQLTALRTRYIDLLATRLGELLGRLVADSHDDLAGPLNELVHHHGVQLAELLPAPEISYRLLWPGRHQDTDTAKFLTRTWQEALAPAGVPRLSNPILAARGPDILGADGSPLAIWPHRELPIDAASRFALTVDVAGTAVRLARPLLPLSPAQVLDSLAKLDGAVTGIATTAEPAWRVVRDFTEVVMLLPDPAEPSQFSSGSSGQFVARVVLANPQLTKVTTVHLAEALVHEAIHGVLYMDEQHDPWVLDPALYAGPMRVTSPWTGSPLPLRPFLQACFVWFGLLSFWSRALPGPAFERDQVRERLVVAASGFLRGDLLQRVAKVRDRLSYEVWEAVSELQRLVVSLLGDEIPSRRFLAKEVL
ncbi:aKG-HExxH-type peptide beta-hydroxylase [Streptomyces sp. NPDC088253]|uniref:aKG-HExxH-type peptide beta-hydroxylase n=1 Tax=Streptomyces sp. NPDC088253 TaxID=3365846 RepID=UPI003829B622